MRSNGLVCVPSTIASCRRDSRGDGLALHRSRQCGRSACTISSVLWPSSACNVNTSPPDRRYVIAKRVSEPMGMTFLDAGFLSQMDDQRGAGHSCSSGRSYFTRNSGASGVFTIFALGQIAPHGATRGFAQKDGAPLAAFRAAQPTMLDLDFAASSDRHRRLSRPTIPKRVVRYRAGSG